MGDHTPTYAWYGKNYPYAKLGQEAFERVLAEAEARVDERICHRGDLEAMPDDELRAYGFAVCAACEALADPAVVSYSASDVSETFVDAESAAVGRVIDRMLSQTRSLLLYGAWL